ncbi:hypothetical protein [Wandonia haliotis]|uniref:hypothetical protein n=1 Tax=Wandonia haliotis TaxID=574963 RepID=UPI0031DF8CA8
MKKNKLSYRNLSFFALAGLFFLLPFLVFSSGEINKEEFPVAPEKKQFEEGFNDRYASDEFNYSREIVVNDEMSFFERLWARFWEWLSEILYTPDGEPTNWNLIFKILAVLAIAGLVFLILRSFFRDEISGIFKRKRKIHVSEVIAENIQKVDFEQLVAKAIEAKDFRLAVRYYYLWLLKQLSAGNVIIWHKDKTNTEYLYEIKDQTTRNQFAYLSYIYDYCWYGEFELDAEQFRKTEEQFKKAVRTKYE